MASGGLDEHDVERLLAAGAPIDVFGIGTRYNVSADAPSLDLVYKLVAYGERDVLKLSEGKETWVGRKALYRTVDAEGKMAGDVLALAEEAPPDGAGSSLLEPVMRGGELLRPHPPLAEFAGTAWRRSPRCPTVSAGSEATRSIRSAQRGAAVPAGAGGGAARPRLRLSRWFLGTGWSRLTRLPSGSMNDTYCPTPGMSHGLAQHLAACGRDFLQSIS